MLNIAKSNSSKNVKKINPLHQISVLIISIVMFQFIFSCNSDSNRNKDNIKFSENDIPSKNSIAPIIKENEPKIDPTRAFDKEISTSPEINNAIKHLAENLDSAKFAPIRQGWQFDYGFRDGWLLNKFEYLRSLLTYKDFQSKFKHPIYLSGPHTRDNLNLNSNYSFGHYNPKFLALLHKSVLQIMSEKDFITFTKPLLEKYNILEFFKKNKDIYEITQKYPDAFDRIKLDYIKKIQNKTLSAGEYRDLRPSMLNSEDYWNWSETSYHFWIRRDIDSTKDLWIELINDVLNGYEYEPEKTNKKNNTKNFLSNIEIGTNPKNTMTFEEAKTYCQSLGNGWRIPDRQEMYALYEIKDSIGFFGYYFWTSELANSEEAWYQYMGKGGSQHAVPINSAKFVWPIREKK
jgi:hypothetical protein